MKQLTAIFLFVLFLFNLVGYQLLFYYMGNKSQSKYEAIIDSKDYNEADLLTIKVDINMPYQVERTEFERVNGEITVDGVVYQYVKRRIYNGQLVMLCIPNHEKTKIHEAKNKYVEFTNDLAAKDQSSESSSKHSVQKNSLGDYDFEAIAGLTSIAFTLDTINVLINEILPTSHWQDSPAQPPEFTAAV